MRLLVCGGRDYTDYDCVYDAIDRWWADHHLMIDLMSKGKPEIISGMASGADNIAAQYAVSRGLKLHDFPADWQQYGKQAGYIRNKQMLLEGKPNAVMAFPGGVGTKMMIDLALKAKVPVIGVERDPLGNIIMGTLGASSSSHGLGIKTLTFQKKYTDKILEMKLLTPGQRDGIYREIMQEEMDWMASQDQAAVEYEEILRMQELMEKLNGDPTI